MLIKIDYNAMVMKDCRQCIRNDKKKKQQPSNIEIGVFRSLKDRSC